MKDDGLQQKCVEHQIYVDDRLNERGRPLTYNIIDKNPK
jgi:hypothetical protein